MNDKEMTDEEFVEDMRTYRLDHLPDGWPAVRQWQIDRLLDIIDRAYDLDRISRRILR
jgi:hypothetical protein